MDLLHLIVITFIPPTSKASVIIAAAKARVRQGANSPSSGFGDTQLYLALNDINEWFTYWTFEPQQSGMQPFSFLRKEKLFTAKSNTTLDGAISAASDTLNVADASIWPEDISATSPGAFYIKNADQNFDFCTFESKSSNTLSALDTIDLDHITASAVYKLYPLPSDYGRPRTLKISENNHYTWLDGEYLGPPPIGYFSTMFLSTSTLGAQNSGKMFLVLPIGVSSGTQTLFYVRKPSVIVDGDSYIDAPDGIARSAVIFKMMEYMWELRGETSMADKYARKADEKMRHFASSQASVDTSVVHGPMYAADEV